MNPASLTESWKRLREGLLRDHPDIDEETLSDTLDGITGAKDLVASLTHPPEARRGVAEQVPDAPQTEGPVMTTTPARELRDALAEALWREAVPPSWQWGRDVDEEWREVWRTAADRFLASLPSVKLKMGWEE